MEDLATKAAWQVLPEYKEQVEQLEWDLQRADPAQRRALLAKKQLVKMEARHVNALQCKIVFVRPARARA